MDALPGPSRLFPNPGPPLSRRDENRRRRLARSLAAWAAVRQRVTAGPPARGVGGPREAQVFGLTSVMSLARSRPCFLHTFLVVRADLLQ